MEINGLPLHPLVVHAAVVFGPLAALAGARLRRRAAAGATGSAGRWSWLAVGRRRCDLARRTSPATNFLEQQRPQLASEARDADPDHEDRAELLLLGHHRASPLVVAASAWRSVRLAAAGRPRPATPSLARRCWSRSLVVARSSRWSWSSSPATPAPGRSGAASHAESVRCSRRRAAGGTTRPAPGRPCPAATASSSPHSGSSVAVRAAARAVLGQLVEVGERLDQVAPARTWASPNDRMPGVSMIQPPSSSGSAQHAAPTSRCAGRGR